MNGKSSETACGNKIWKKSNWFFDVFTRGLSIGKRAKRKRFFCKRCFNVTFKSVPLIFVAFGAMKWRQEKLVNSAPFACNLGKVTFLAASTTYNFIIPTRLDRYFHVKSGLQSVFWTEYVSWVKCVTKNWRWFFFTNVLVWICVKFLWNWYSSRRKVCHLVENNQSTKLQKSKTFSRVYSQNCKYWLLTNVMVNFVFFNFMHSKSYTKNFLSSYIQLQLITFFISYYLVQNATFQKFSIRKYCHFMYYSHKGSTSFIVKSICETSRQH